MNVENARAILEAAKEGGYLEEDLPDDDEQLVKDAQFYLTHARAAVEAEQDDEVIRRIVELGEEAQKTNGYQQEEETEAPAPEVVAEENLPIPKQIAGDPPDMPYDLSETSNKDVRRLASEFNACLSRVVWLLSQALDEELSLKHLRDDAYQRAYLAEAEEAEKEERKSTKEDKDSAAKQSKEYKELDAKVREAEKTVRKYKALKEIYGGNIDRLSREATLRDDEFRRSGGR